MKKFTVAILVAVMVSVVFSAKAKADIFEYNAKVSEVYVNDQGTILVKISVATATPEGFLIINGDLNNPTTKGLFTAALLAQVTQRTCWIRVVSNTTTYWSLAIISMLAN